MYVGVACLGYGDMTAEAMLLLPTVFSMLVYCAGCFVFYLPQLRTATTRNSCICRYIYIYIHLHIHRGSNVVPLVRTSFPLRAYHNMLPKGTTLEPLGKA